MITFLNTNMLSQDPLNNELLVKYGPESGSSKEAKFIRLKLSNSYLCILGNLNKTSGCFWYLSRHD